MKKQLRSLSKRIERVSMQSIRYVEHMRASGDRRVRVSILSDTYDFQSYASVHLLTEGVWNEIVAVPGPSMAVKPGLVHRFRGDTGVAFAEFMPDRNKLIKLTREVL